MFIFCLYMVNSRAVVVPVDLATSTRIYLIFMNKIYKKQFPCTSL